MLHLSKKPPTYVAGTNTRCLEGTCYGVSWLMLGRFYLVSLLIDIPVV